MKTIIAVSHICLAVFLVGCARQERSARSSPPQASTDPHFVLRFYTNLYFARGVTVTITTQAQNEAYIYVTGEVNRPGRIPWTNGLTLTKALEQAGGFTGFASKSQVMLRRANGATEQYSFVPPVADRTKNAKPDSGDMIHATSRAWLWPSL